MSAKTHDGRHIVLRRRLIMLIIGALCINICCTYPQSHKRVEETIDHWQRRQVNLSATQSPPNADAPAESMKNDTDAVGLQPLDLLIRQALQRNPGLRAAAANARAKLEKIPQATALPDPIIKALVRPEPIQTAAGNVYLTLGINQTFPLPAKLHEAGNIAAAETRMALEQLNTKRIQLIADVQQAYWHIYRLDRYLEIARDNQRVLADLQQSIDAAYRVGKVQQQDLLRVQTELAKLKDDEYRYALQRTAAAAALNQLTDQPPHHPIDETAPVNVPALSSDVDYLIKLSIEHNPELAALRERIERDRRRIELARLGYWPDLTLGFEWNYLEGRDAFEPPPGMRPSSPAAINRHSETGVDNWGLLLQMNLPIWTQRIEAARREARQQAIATQSEFQAAENMIEFRVFDAWSRIEAQQHTLAVLDGELIPQARQTYDVTLTAYQGGETDFLTLIDNWRRWLDFELMRHRETVDFQIAFADLQREVGVQLLYEQPLPSSPSEGPSHEQ